MPKQCLVLAKTIQKTKEQPQKAAPPKTVETTTNQALQKKIILRKEVIQPHLPVRLPCYDFVPIANPTFDHSPHKRG